MFIISKILSLLVDLRIYLYKIGIFKTYKIKTKVISIGNLKVGGTGKTPFTIFLANLLQKEGFKVGIIGKGYKRKSKGCVVYDSIKSNNPTAEEIGDEMLLIAQKTNCPVLVHNEKYLAAQEIEKLYDLDFILLDDGFQHLQLKRNLDILMIDNETIQKGKVFPSGRLREKIENYKRTDIICKIDYNQNYNFIDKMLINVEKTTGEIYLLGDEKRNFINSQNIDLNRHSEHSEVSIKSNSNEENGFLTSLKMTLLKQPNIKLITVSGLANPNGFYNTINKLGITITEKIEYPDHFEYSAKEIEKLIQKIKEFQSESFITTEKDAIKLVKHLSIFLMNNINVFVLPIDINFIEGKEQFLSKIRSL